MIKKMGKNKQHKTMTVSVLHLFLLSISMNGISTVRMAMAAQNNNNSNIIPVDVGVVLDMDTLVGKMGLSCLKMALSDFYAAHDHYKTRVVLHSRDSKQDIVRAASAALDLIKNVQVKAIIGPEFSIEANFMIDLGDKAQVPVISFSATSPSLSPLRNPYFIRAIQNDSSQVAAISSIINYFGWKEAVPIYVDNEFGEGIIPFLTDALGSIDTRVPYRSVISPAATDDQIAEELYKLMTIQTRVVIVHMLQPLSSRVFAKAAEIGMMDAGYVWIVTDGIGNVLSTLNSSDLDSMQGALIIKTYFPNSKLLKELRARWTEQFLADYPEEINPELDIFGLRAYDAAFALAMAVEQVWQTNGTFSFQRSNLSASSSGLESLGVSLAGPGLIESLSNVSFTGLAGQFHLIDGHLPTSAMQIVNVGGHSWRGIGFWTPGDGLLKQLNFTKGSSDSISSLGVVIWPGDTVNVPKGWEVPTTGKKLRIGVPIKQDFQEFVNVVRDPYTNATVRVEGYCIDVFDAVMRTMPYHVPYEYIPFALPDGTPAGSYNDLVYQVFLQKYDAVVGDTTIIANRSLYVDFTLPYTESGVTMIVPVKSDASKNAWVFLKPLTWELWVTSAAFFVLIGFVTWVLEHRINEDFRGPPANQVGTMFWFSFSTMVFAHKEKVVSNLARFVLIVWFFVVLILTSSYTASLTSMLTVQQLEPTITDVKELIKKGYNVGYQNGSFVYDQLKRMQFAENNLKAYNTPEECEEAFRKGSANGGIAAAFDEIPYMKLFLATRCSKFTMVGPSYKTDGFGFVFPRNSPLVSDVSRAVLNVTQGDKMTAIEDYWFGSQKNCPESSTSVTSNSIGLESFWGLFLLAGLAAAFAFLVAAAMFLYEHRNFLTQDNPGDSIWRKIVKLSRYFDHKDLSSHTFRKAGERDRSVINGERFSGSAQASPSNNFPTSPASYTDTDFSFHGEHAAAASVEHSEPSPDSQTDQEIWSCIELTDQQHEDTVTTHAI